MLVDSLLSEIVLNADTPATLMLAYARVWWRASSKGDWAGVEKKRNRVGQSKQAGRAREDLDKGSRTDSPKTADHSRGKV